MEIKKFHMLLVIGAVLALVLFIAAFRGGPPTGLAGIQSEVILRLNQSINYTCILNVNWTEYAGSFNYSYNGKYEIPTGIDTEEVSINFTNAGNRDQTVSINGSPWSPATLGCNQTHYYNVSATAWGDATPVCVGSTALLIGNQYPDTFNFTYLRVRVPAGQAAATYTQNILLIQSC